ncbi:MAG: PH domain-containing protein [Saprospiraceae bacterium]|nr:PH domain-containing protein [Saprospiraceae bacterium]
MGYLENNLLGGESIYYQTHVHWTIYLKGLLSLIFGIFLISIEVDSLGIIFILISFLILSMSKLKIHNSEIAVTNKRVLIKEGLITTQSLELMLNKIEAIHVKQGLIGKMFNSGTIEIIGTGGTNSHFSNIFNPLEFRRAVNYQITKSNL